MSKVRSRAHPISLSRVISLIFYGTIAYLEAPNQEPKQELHSRAAPSVEAHHLVNGPDTGRNSRGRRKKKFKSAITFSDNLLGFHSSRFYTPKALSLIS